MTGAGARRRGRADRISRLSCAAGLAGAIFTGRAALAAPPTATAPDWAFGEPAGEAALAAGSLLALSAYAIPRRPCAWGPDAARAHDAGFAAASDVTGAYIGSTLQLGATYLLETAYLDAAGIQRPGVRALRTTLVEVEALALSTGITELLKRTTARCRPRAWVDGRCVGRADDTAAFPSGHTSSVSAIAGVELRLALGSIGEPSARWAGFAVAEAGALGTALLRVLAGAHSASDVAAGWVVGHATGAAVAAVHAMEELSPAGEPATVRAPASLMWVGSF